MKPEQEVMRYFYKATNQRITPAQAKMTVGQAKNLLKVYEKQELIDCIDYLVKNPPPKGFVSLGFLSYAANEILAKINKEKFRETIKEKIQFDIDTSEPSEGNKEKFLKNKTKKIKGMGRF